MPSSSSPSPPRLTLFFLLLCLPSLSLSSPHHLARRSATSSSGSLWSRFLHMLPISRRADAPVAYYSPADAGGSMLTKSPNTYPPAGEPLNVIISGLSTPAVLKNQEVDGGFLNFMLGVGFAGECLGQHEGEPQTADLGDGTGYVNETAVLRWDYGDPSLGTCMETIKGGNHFRYWTQDGASANSSAIFLATSAEKPIAEQHNIIPDGYNLGRDWLIGNMTGSPINTTALTNTSTFEGTTSWAGYVYSSKVSYVSGLLANSSKGINHADTVPVGGRFAVDGLVAVVEVTITTIPENATKSAALRVMDGMVVGKRVVGAVVTVGMLLLGAMVV
ncbi:hypothetical protein MKEN_00355000 [Mycena kentingensis (nom. inval.)]|nr:hypothetical protein MKEN_00355000 [Mycena kentingensis (nom. inval.)]